jgi:hypothetical protein
MNISIILDWVEIIVCMSETIVLMSVDIPVDIPPLDVELRAVGAAD